MPAPQRSAARRALDAVGEAASTGLNWLDTQSNKAAAEFGALPRNIPEASLALSQLTGIPERVLYPVGPLAMMPYVRPYARKYLPTEDEVYDFVRRNGIGSVRQMWRRLEAMYGGTPYVPTPEVNLPGLLGRMVDGGVRQVMTAPLTGAVKPITLAKSFLTGFGTEPVSQGAREYDKEHGTNSEAAAKVAGAAVDAVELPKRKPRPRWFGR